jgi:aspartyl-tRNA(Asn)/glutamyl-tRNA(Gln) amidotransferase subunit C
MVLTTRLIHKLLMITLEEAKHIAQLARINFTDKEFKSLQNELSSILAYIDKLKEVKMEAVEPTSHSVELINVFRADNLNKEDSETVDKLVDLAPQKKGRFVKVKSVF